MELLKYDEVFDTGRFADLKREGHLIDTQDMAAYESRIRSNKSAMPDPSYWSGKRVIVTGAAGMVGSTIIDQLADMGAELHGIVKRHAVTHLPNIQHNIRSGKLKTIEADLRDYSRVLSIIKDIEPHAIFHQAAESFVPTSIQQPAHVVENNCVSTVNLLEAGAKEGKSLEGLQVACSSEQYGFIKDRSELPVKESNELRPTSTYAATKVFTENVAKAYYFCYKTPTVITRTFNQEGPRRGPQFFTARVAMQIADVLAKESDRIVIGNPNAVRDFTHIHDSARAQIMAVERCERGQEYNICTGMGITTGDYVNLARDAFSLQNPILVDKKLLRPYEKGEALFDGFIGDSGKFRAKTGWAPTKSVVEIIKDSVAYFQKQSRN